MSEPLQVDLQTRFRETTRVRLQNMTMQLEILGRDPSDRAAAAALSHAFHALAGMGGTYGFPRVTELGDEAEASILPLIRRQAAIPPELLARWRAIVEDVAAEIAE